MRSPLTHMLIKIFATGFYRVHAGILFFVLFIMVGMVEPSQLLNYHKTLMLAFITSPLMMSVVFTLWLIYTFKCWHYIAGQLFSVQQQFLFYSSTAYDKTKQAASWAWVQVSVGMPVFVYAIISIMVAIRYQHWLSALSILVYVLLLIAVSARFYLYLVGKQSDGSSLSLALRFTKSWRKPYFSLYIYHVLNRLKVTWLITKILSYLIINGVFLLFADVSHDVRVAGIAILGIAVSHSVMIFNERQFEEVYLSFSRNLPQSRLSLFGGFALVYLVLLLPEGVWLFSRFSPSMAFGLMAMGLSVALLYHSLLYYVGLDMEKYMPWVLGLFVLMFWAILFKLLWILVIVNLLIGYGIFYTNYYRFTSQVSKQE